MKNRLILVTSPLQVLTAKTAIDSFKENNNEFLLVSHGVGKYGRPLGELCVISSYIRSEKYQGKSINEMLVKEGHAVEYNK